MLDKITYFMYGRSDIPCGEINALSSDIILSFNIRVSRTLEQMEEKYKYIN